MARRKAQNGQCHICGCEGKLSFEHVPPECAYNDRPLIKLAIEDMIKDDFQALVFGDGVRGKIQQGGAGGYTLCETCNNNTGAAYGKSYGSWVEQGMSFLHKVGDQNSVALPFFIYPLRVIKQIVTMFFSTNGVSFRTQHPDLVKFVLDPGSKYLDPRIRIYSYLTFGMRQTGIMSRIRVQENDYKFEMLSEIAFPPFGYLLAIDGADRDQSLVDISFFARFDYDEWVNLFLPLPLLPVILPFVGDYRTRQEIQSCVRNSSENGLLGY